jgi:hypothetical protein
VATRRKYKVPAFKDGGRVPEIDNIIVAPPVEAAPVAAPIEAPPPPIAADDHDPLVRAHAAQMRAEEIQRNVAKQPQSIAGRPQTIDDVVNAIPGLTEHKRAFLRANPNLLEPASVDQVRFHYHAALNAGVVDDTPQMNQAILGGIARERQRAVQEARSVVEAAAAPPRRPSVQVSAPVSRAAPAMSGRRERDDQNTLSPEERDIARRSIIDRPDMPKMSDSEKEYQYLQNRNRYRAMLADGSYSEQTK